MIGIALSNETSPLMDVESSTLVERNRPDNVKGGQYSRAFVLSAVLGTVIVMFSIMHFGKSSENVIVTSNLYENEVNAILANGIKSDASEHIIGAICPGGTYNPVDGSTSSDDCQPCPAGTFNPLSDSVSIADCLACTAGNYCPTGSFAPTICPAGNFCPSGSSSPTTCIAGAFCPSRSPSPILCAGGKYNPDTGSTSSVACKLCTSGAYCPSGAVAPTACPGGSYCLSGFAAPSPCTNAGYFCPAASSTPTICPAGYYCLAGSLLPSDCATSDATKGHWTSKRGAKAQSNCACTASWTGADCDVAVVV